MKRILTFTICFCICCFAAHSQEFDYNAGFGYHFDNAEYSQSHNLFQPSGTVHLADFYAEGGFSFDSGRNMKHKVLVGFDVAKNMGEQSDDNLNKELLLSYQMDVKTLWGSFSAVFGCFPRTFSEGEYCDALFGRDIYYTDRNFEGIFLKYREKGFYSEIGLDWMGMYGPDRRERFQIMSAGKWKMSDWLWFGWDASMYHFAGSEVFRNVVDNMMVHPYLQISPDVSMQKFSLSAGWIQKYDRDRSVEGSASFHGGALINLGLKNWNVGVENDFYFGQDLMPLFAGSNNGVKYGTDLYFGNRFYHTQIEGFSIYDRAEIYYEPSITSWLDFRVSAIFNVGNPTQEFSFFRGWQQMLSLRVNLEKIRTISK